MKSSAPKRYQSMRTVSRDHIAAKSYRVWVCRGCNHFNRSRYDRHLAKPAPPVSCEKCNRMDFDELDSEAEAIRWMTFRLAQDEGLIRELERQVHLDLLTVGPDGLPVKWAEMVADFRFFDVVRQRRVIAEVKPDGLMSYDAKLKIRCLEAMGVLVEIFT